MRAIFALALAGCALAAPPPPVAARSDAPIGRLAGAPASLRPGVAVYDLPPIVEAPPMHHHHP